MRFSIIFIIISALISYGCVSTAIICSTAVALKGATDPRSIKQQVNDTVLEALINIKLNKNKDIIKKTRIIVIAYKGNVLLIGQSPDISLIEIAKQIAVSTNGVSAVYNEIRNEFPVNLGIASKDIWITTNIKSKILSSDKVKLGNIKIITENSEVFLLGIVTKKEGDYVAKIASSTNGVTRVTTAFTYLNLK